MFASLRGQGERFLGLTGLMAGGFLGLTALQAEGCGGGFAADYKVSVTGFIFSVMWHDKHSADWLAALANRVEIIHPSHTTVRTVRYTAVQFLGQIIFS